MSVNLRAGRWLAAGLSALVVFVGLALSSGARAAEPAYPATLATEISKYPHATLTMVQKTKDATHAMLQSNDTPDKVMAYYRAELTAKGWDIGMETATPEVEIMEATKTGHTMTINAVSGESGNGTPTPTIVNIIFTH